MSYSGYPPYQQGPPGSAPYPQQNPSSGAPYPYSPQGGVFPPSVGYGMGAPMYMPQPYAGMGGYPPGPGSDPMGGYPSTPTGGYPPAPGSAHTGYPSAPGSGPTGYPPTPGSAHAGYPPTPGSAYTGYPPAPSSAPMEGYPSAPASAPSGGYSPCPSSVPYPNLGGTHSSHNSTHYGSPSSCGRPSPVKKGSPTVVPAQPFDPRQDAEILRKAMKGFGTDEKAIINVLSRRSNPQRLEIIVQFKTLYGKDLIKDLKSELSGNFENLVVAMMTPLPQYYAKELHDAISGLGTDEDVLIEVMCSLNNHEIRTIREAYESKYNQSLESDLKGDTGGTFKRLMVSLCNAGRDDSNITNPEAAAADAQALLRAGELRFGTDESTFNMILCQRNYAQLRLVFQEYQRLTGHDIEKAIKGEFSGDAEDGLLAVVRSVKSQPAFFAKRLNKSMKGLGTNDRDLIRLVVTRSEIDMGEIKRDYQAQFGESLADAIKGDCSGDYKKCLLALIGESN